jgi:predicted adenylyl cyclase CyaB
LARNIEIKAAVSDLDAVRRSVRTIAPQSPQIIDQIDTFFVVPAGRLKVREFADGSGELIAYDRPDQSGPKTSTYSIVRCDGARTLVEIFARLVPMSGRVVKRRELWMIGRTRVHLDEVETLGAFVELEVVLRDDEPSESGEREARELMGRLGIGDEALVPEAYIDLVVSGDA